MRRLFILGVAGILSGFCPVLAENSGGNRNDDEETYPVCAIQPPEGAEIQKWEFCYDYYLVCEFSPEDRTGSESEYCGPYMDCVRPVDCVIDGDFIYFRGVSMTTPEFWIRGEIVGESEVVFPNEQYLGRYEYNSKDVIYESYFTPCTFDWEDGYSTHSFWVTIFARPTHQDLRCSYDRKTGLIIPYDKFDSNKKNSYGDFGFALSNGEGGYLIGGGWFMDKETGHTKYYDKEDMYVNVSFRKAVSGDVDEITGDAGEEDTSVYDLSGRKVDAESLSPGIYIRSGKKVVIRN